MSYSRLLAVFFLFIIKQANCQKEATNWFFGYSAGLNFSNNEVTPLSESSLKAVEGCAVISDKVTGNLLFYTDGRNFWNSSHQLMPSSNLSTDCSTVITQPAIIIPDANSDYLYHTFCIRPHPEFTQGISPTCVYTRTDVLGDGLALIYYLIDMRLDGGRGDIVKEKSNVILRTDITEKITAVPHANGKDYWVIVHGWNNDRFYAYLLTANNLDPPITTDIGSIHGLHDYQVDIYQELSGQIKASPNGQKIACAVGLQNRPFDLFDFDNLTGTLSNYMNLGDVLGQYGVSFSPDNSKLYVTSDGRETDPGQRSIILQYDLNASNPQAIINSRMSIIANNPNTNIPPSGVFDGFDFVKKGMALGVDGRLYVTGNSDNTTTSNEPHLVVVIDKPNQKGFACDVNQRTFDFKHGIVTIGLPNFMQHYFNNTESNTVCGDVSSISLFPNPTTRLVTIGLPLGCDQRFKVELFNSLGQKILFSDEAVVNLTGLADGIYYFKILTPYNDTVIRKIVKN